MKKKVLVPAIISKQGNEVEAVNNFVEPDTEFKSLATTMAEKLIEGLQKSLQKELDDFRNCQKEYEKAVTKRQLLDAQLNENTSVKKELDLLNDDDEVYKLIGPVLIKQDLEEARQNVAKRMDYITGELKRLDGVLTDIDKREGKHRETLTTLQRSLQEATITAAPKKLT